MHILVRGGGDLASGVVMRLHTAGWHVLITELNQPRAVRRLVSFAQAVYDGEVRVEGIFARRVTNAEEIQTVLGSGGVPVVVDPDLAMMDKFHPHVIVDARMRKAPPEIGLEAAPLIVGLGPGFIAGINCHAAIETNRGPFLGRVIWQGSPQADTGVPEQVGNYHIERVLRAPNAGVVEPEVEIGMHVTSGQIVARVNGTSVRASFDGVLRGLTMGGLLVAENEKIGDIDPRDDPRLSWMVSDKALAIGGGVLEAILSWQPLREFLWTC